MPSTQQNVFFLKAKTEPENRLSKPRPATQMSHPCDPYVKVTGWAKEFHKPKRNLGANLLTEAQLSVPHFEKSNIQKGGTHTCEIEIKLSRSFLSHTTTKITFCDTSLVDGFSKTITLGDKL